MQEIKKIYDKIGDVVVQVVYWASGLSVFLFTMIMFAQVFGRNVLKTSMVWANDVIVIFYVWAAFFGSAVAVRHKEHYVVEIFPPKDKLINMLLDILGDIAGVLLFYVLIRYGFDFASRGMKRLSDSMGVPMGYFYYCIPISSIFAMFFTIGHIFEDVGKLADYLKGGKKAVG